MSGNPKPLSLIAEIMITSPITTPIAIQTAAFGLDPPAVSSSTGRGSSAGTDAWTTRAPTGAVWAVTSPPCPETASTEARTKTGKRIGTLR